MSLSPDANEADRQHLIEVLEKPSDAVMLYGSFARRDATARSDIDVLQLVRHRRPSYRLGRVSVATTTADPLRALAAAGSLFVLHLRCEGVRLQDDCRILQDILESYRPPTSYGPLLRSLRICAGLLDVPRDHAVRNLQKFTQLALYLLRTTVYARCAEEGRPLFAMRAVATHLGDPVLADLIVERENSAGDIEFFEQTRSVLERYLGGRCENPFGSIEALAVAVHEESRLASALAVRLLGGVSIQYEDLLPDGIAP